MTTTSTNKDDVPVRPFADVIRELGQGAIVDDAAVQLQTVVEAVKTYGKKGILKLTIEVAPMKGNPDALLVQAKVEAKAPVGDPTAAVFFSDDHGNLVRDDPKQDSLPFREDEDTNVSRIRS